ncbi:transcription antitermination protein [Halobaculum sp. MBLA0147]|uniref:transcription antitermination protein n=1 Tax=Halobaculum sp. MBLA0147 TaxID=3079934 RepID=UPI0035263EA7
MDAEEFTDTLRDAHETPLSRLGSSKSLYALTGGEMAGDAVRAVVAREAALVADALAGWSDDETGETSDASRELFADVAATADEHAGIGEPDDRAFPDVEALAATEGEAARLGALLARQVLADTRIGQAVGFFVGDADPSGANEFRDLREDVTADLAAVQTRLGDVVAAADDPEAAREAARTAADEVLTAAYDDYVETLESLGVEPKNVC